MKKILLVEDEENLAEIVKDELTDAGYEVQTANTAKECIDKMKTFKPDLFILDIKLPDMSGLKLLEIVRNDFGSAAIMMCTAYDSFKTDYEVWSAKISDYIVKPVDLDDLKRRIRWILGE
jgi:DNA-binding response OmpR family regulator